MWWLTAVPRAIVRSALRGIGQLRAEESLLESQRVLVGRRLRDEGASDLLRQWALAAYGPGPVERPSSPTELKRRVGASGIGYRRVAKKK
jgi:hypothetical protein